MEQSDYEALLTTRGEEIGLSLGEMKAIFPFVEFKDDALDLDECIDDHIRICDEKAKEEEDEAAMNEKDPPLHDWDRFYNNFGTYDGY